MIDIPMPEAPEGYEWVECVYDPLLEGPKLTYNGEWYSLVRIPEKKYDWGKTVGRALVVKDGNVIKFSCVYHDDIDGLSMEWIPHFGGECPFDAEACVVEIAHRTGSMRKGDPLDMEWDHRDAGDIIAVRFVKLKEGYTF